MSKVEVLMIGPYPAWDMEDMEQRYTVHKLWEAQDKDAFLATHAPAIRAIATRGELGAKADLMQKLPKLEIVSCYGVGVDGIDLEYARKNNIRVTNTPDVLSADVADLGMGLLIAAARQIPTADAFVRSGQWTKGNMHLVTRVNGKKLGIVGMGRIGSIVARRASGFECDIAYYDINRRDDLPYEFVDNLIELARRSEFLIMTTAGGEGTRNLIGAEALEALGPDGIFVNISRGTTVDEAALLDALENGKIKAAGLDVFLNEPAINEKFMKLPNVVLQPHHASGTIETRKAMGELVRKNLQAYFDGKELLTPVV